MRIIKPMLAKKGKPFNDPNWIFEFKYDGTRALLYFENGQIRFINRREKDITHRYPEFSDLSYNLHCNECILDGEIIVEKDGVPNFFLLQKREQNEEKLRIEILSKLYPAKYIVFDILYLNGEYLLDKPLMERKKILEKVVENSNKILKTPFISEFGKELYAEAIKAGFEGIMAKKKDSIYEEGKRSDFWLKIKKVQTEDYVILGYTKGKGNRESTFGALLIGGYRNGRWFYVSKVGTGFDEETREMLMKKFKRLKTKKYFDLPKELEKEEIVFLKPKLVCEVKFVEKTPKGKLRAPVFLRLRDDKSPEECVYEILH